MSKITPLVVYWSVNTPFGIAELGKWTMLYPEPVSIYHELLNYKSKTAKNKGMISCPAFSNRFKKTFMFKNGLESSYLYETNEDNTGLNITPIGENFMRLDANRAPSLTIGPHVDYNMSYYFFCEESITAHFSPPYFHEPKYLRYGAIIPGSFDIGQWFRPFNCELQMWQKKGKLHIEEGEPLFYVEFLTDRPIILKKFEMTPKLWQYGKNCVDAPAVFGFNAPLLTLYKRFKDTNMRASVLKEIKDNLLDM